MLTRRQLHRLHCDSAQEVTVDGWTELFIKYTSTLGMQDIGFFADIRYVDIYNSLGR